ncbi:hypothetical protein ACWCQN_30570 [Streptomyces sp. NPDC001984]
MTGPKQTVRCTCDDDPWRYTGFPGYALPPFDPEALRASRPASTPEPVPAPRRKVTADTVWNAVLGAVGVVCLVVYLLTFAAWRKSS